MGTTFAFANVSKRDCWRPAPTCDQDLSATVFAPIGASINVSTDWLGDLKARVTMSPHDWAIAGTVRDPRTARVRRHGHRVQSPRHPSGSLRRNQGTST